MARMPVSAHTSVIACLPTPLRDFKAVFMPMAAMAVTKHHLDISNNTIFMFWETNRYFPGKRVL